MLHLRRNTPSRALVTEAPDNCVPQSSVCTGWSGPLRYCDRISVRNWGNLAPCELDMGPIGWLVLCVLAVTGGARSVVAKNAIAHERHATGREEVQLCGSWQFHYSKLHKSIISGQQPGRYAISVPAPAGLSDRLVGLVTVFLYALLTNRAFQVAGGWPSKAYASAVARFPISLLCGQQRAQAVNSAYIYMHRAGRLTWNYSSQCMTCNLDHFLRDLGCSVLWKASF